MLKSFALGGSGLIRKNAYRYDGNKQLSAHE